MIPAIEPLCCRRCDRYRLQKTRCTSIFADSIACGLIGPFISLQRVRLGGDRFLPPEKQRGFWSMSGRTPAIVMVGQSADMLSCRSRPFFCSAELDSKVLPRFIQARKQWTSQRLSSEMKFASPIWQQEFFGHSLRSSGSYSQKWEYVKETWCAPD